MDDFSGLFLRPSTFSIKDRRSAQILDGALSDFLYELNSYILLSSESITTPQKSLFSYSFS